MYKENTLSKTNFFESTVGALKSTSSLTVFTTLKGAEGKEKSPAPSYQWPVKITFQTFYIPSEPFYLYLRHRNII